MKSNQNDFVRYVSSNVLGMIGISCYILADTFFIANGVGSDGLTALNLVLPVYSLINGMGLMLGMGGATRFSILKGQDRVEEAAMMFSRILKLAVLVSLIFTAVGVIFTESIVKLLGAEGEIIPLSVSYIRTMSAFSAAFIINNVVLCFVRNDGEPNLSMMGMVSGSLANIGLDYLFIFPLGMGMFGAAFATCISPLLSLLILSAHWKRKKSSIHFRRCSLDLSGTLKASVLGVSSLITELASGITILVFNFSILSLTGNLGVAAYGIIANIALVVVAIFTGIAQGIQPLISLNHGLGKADLVKQTYRMAVALAVVIGVCCWGTGSLFAESVTAVFNNAKDPALSEIAVRGIRLYFSSFVMAGINIVTISYLASTALTKQSFFLSLMRGVIAVLPIILLFSAIWGMDGVWMTIPAVELVTMIFCGMLLIRKR